MLNTTEKFFSIVSSVITIAVTVGGAFTGIDRKGDEWGNALAATVFGFGFAVCSLAFWMLMMWGFAKVGRFRRDCPVCRGRGIVQSGYNAIMEPSHSVCPKCQGDGLIW